MGPDQLLRPLFAIIHSPPGRKVLGFKHCTRRVLGGVKCDDASSSRYSAVRQVGGRLGHGGGNRWGKPPAKLSFVHHSLAPIARLGIWRSGKVSASLDG